MKGVVGSNGNTIPITPNTKEIQPPAISKYLVIEFLTIVRNLAVNSARTLVEVQKMIAVLLKVNAVNNASIIITQKWQRDVKGLDN